MTSPNIISAIALPDSAPGNPEKMTALTLSSQGRLTVAGALITTIVLLLTSVIFSINSLAWYHKSKSFLSPIDCSIATNSSPDVALTNIMATSASFAISIPESISSLASTCFECVEFMGSSI